MLKHCKRVRDIRKFQVVISKRKTKNCHFNATQISMFFFYWDSSIKVFTIVRISHGTVTLKKLSYWYMSSSSQRAIPNQVQIKSYLNGCCAMRRENSNFICEYILFVWGLSRLTSSTTDGMRRENSGTALGSTKKGIFLQQQLAIYLLVCSATNEKEEIT